MTINTTPDSPIRNLLTDLEFIEKIFLSIDYSTQVLLVEGVLHSANPNAIVDALVERVGCWTEGYQEAFTPVVEKANELWNTPLSFTQKASIAEEWAKEHGFSNLECVTMEAMIEEVAMNGDADDVLYEVMRYNERHFKQFITCRYDFDDLIGWFNETLLDYVSREYTFNEVAQQCRDHEIAEAAVRNVDISSLIDLYRERDHDVGLYTVPDALENNMDYLIDQLSTYFAKPENFEKYGEKLVKALHGKNVDFLGKFVGIAGEMMSADKIYLEGLLDGIQDGIVQELTVDMFMKAQDYIQGLLDTGMWFSDACHLLQFSDKAYQLTGNQEDIMKFWDYLADRCVTPDGVTPKTESPLF